MIPEITLPCPEIPDLRLAAELARLDNEAGGCLSQRIKRAKRIQALVAEQDRRTLEDAWLLPVVVER